ncbi:MAG TPA: polyprenyl synthetase family protein [Actinomycetota bacterium]|nr:polyprenyl synthetase family protein [Actinomycetota bacterium]
MTGARSDVAPPGAPGADPRAEIEAFRRRVDAELAATVATTRADLERRDAGAAFLADELARLIDAGGSKLRPTCCYLGFRAGGGGDGPPIVRAAAALEFLHLLALIHDDVMDRAEIRRGVATSHRRLASVAPPGADADHVGRSLAILVGDLAGVCADVLWGRSGFPPERLARALDRYHAVRLDMAAGQALDIVGGGEPFGVAALKGGSYSIAGPLLVGAALAGASAEVVGVLAAFGAPLGTAFQLLDDLRDGDAAEGVDVSTLEALFAEARAALTDAPFDPEPLFELVDALERG